MRITKWFDRKREQRSTLRRPADWFLEAMGVRKTASGMRVGEEAAFNYSAVYCAVTVISGTFRTLPLFAFRELPDGGKEKIKRHPVYKLLHRRPNSEQTPAQFKAYMQTCALLWNSAYAVITREKNEVRPDVGEPTGLWPVHPREVTPRRLDDTGALVFDVQDKSGGVTTFPDADMLRIYGTSRDGIGGVSLLSAAREAIGLSLATEAHGAEFFGNGAMPGGIITHPEVMGEEAQKRIRQTWNRQFQGSGNRHKTAVLEEGAKYEAIGLPNEVSQFLETRQFQIEEIARWFNIPPHKLKHLLRATFSNIEHQSIEFLADTIMPWVVTWEEELTRKLFAEQEQEDHFAKYIVNGLLRGDSKSRSEFYLKMWQMGVFSINEIRAFEEMNPIGEAGDEHLVQLNMTTIEKLVSEDEPEPGSEPGAAPAIPAENDENNARMDALEVISRVMLRDAYGRIVTREVDRIRRAIKKYGLDDLTGFRDWLEAFYGGSHKTFVIQALQPLAGTLTELTDNRSGPVDWADQWLATSQECVNLIVTGHTDTALSALDGLLGVWTETRADEATNEGIGQVFNVKPVDCS